MSNSSMRRITTGGAITEAGDANAMRVQVCQLNQLALNGLVPMFDASERMFCFRLKREGSRLVREGTSRRYTIMSLLGLHQAEAQGLHSPIDVREVTDDFLRQTDWISNCGDLGLLLWLSVLVLPERLPDAWSALKLDQTFAEPKAKEGRTMELAWLLTGLAQMRLALPTTRPEITDLAIRTYRLLKENQGDHGIFRHLAVEKTLAGVLRGHIGSFADQVYPIYALTRFAQAYKVHAALDEARRCAEAICRAQGPLGQWWWHYDALTGRVAQRYPVYAVHQHGMAPMALFALEDSGHGGFGEAIYKGLCWITGQNELGFDMRDRSARLIWRSLCHARKTRVLLDRVRALAGGRKQPEKVDKLAVTYECRPYELGWLLYAWARRGPE